MPKVSKVLTDKQKKKYIESGYNGCPKCGDTQELISTSQFESDGNQAWRSFECAACGIIFEDIYTLTDVEIR